MAILATGEYQALIWAQIQSVMVSSFSFLVMCREARGLTALSRMRTWSLGQTRQRSSLMVVMSWQATILCCHTTTRPYRDNEIGGSASSVTRCSSMDIPTTRAPAQQAAVAVFICTQL